MQPRSTLRRRLSVLTATTLFAATTGCGLVIGETFEDNGPRPAALGASGNEEGDVGAFDASARDAERDARVDAREAGTVNGDTTTRLYCELVIKCYPEIDYAMAGCLSEVSSSYAMCFDEARAYMGCMLDKTCTELKSTSPSPCPTEYAALAAKLEARQCAAK